MSTYQIALNVFEGPLDLLLRLIERQELDITLVSLAVVADQYLAYISELQRTSAADLADFLVIAAKLLVIKSRALLPRPEDEADMGEEDWEDDLLQRLRDYKRFKEVAKGLRDIEERGLRAYTRIAPPPKIEGRLKPGEVPIEALLEALKQVLESHPPTGAVGDIVSPVVVHIADCIKNVLARTRRYRRIRFSTLMRHARSRTEIIVTFLAILELIKQQRVQVTQERTFGEIYIASREPDPDAEIPPTDLSEYGPLDSTTT